MKISEPAVERVRGAAERVARAMIANRPSLPGARWQRLISPKTRPNEVDTLSMIPEARAAIAEYEAALRDAGFVLVPKNLTPAMAQIGALYCNGAIATRLMWEDLLAVASG